MEKVNITEIDLNIRKFLIDTCRKNKMVFYEDIARLLRITTKTEIERQMLRDTLGHISAYEYQNNRKLISSAAFYKDLAKGHGNGFYKLCELLDIGKERVLKNKEFAIIAFNESVKFWQDDNNYHKYYNLGLDSIDENIKNFLFKNQFPTDGYDSIPNAQPNFNEVDIDFFEKAKSDKIIGDSGEELVLNYEINYLEKLGLRHLAKKVKRVKDGSGYDILSFDLDGNEKYIEVKTTKGGYRTPFHISFNEKSFAQQNSNRYYIYRLYNYNEETGNANFFEIKDEDNLLMFKAVNFEVYIKSR
ncbi:MAG: DUF3883 domain-containing protein [Dysgonomonas mossii]|uniref:DUF3883 domain-containing protein n=1 Tax=Dysgonomonas mossii TaxID=163665 RepID=UPI0039920313